MMFRAPYLRKSVRLQGERSATLDRMRGRVVLIGLFFVAAYASVAVRAFDLAVFQNKSLRGGEAQEGYYNYSDAKVERGNVYDRNGILLATSLPSASLYADPALIISPEQLARQLSKIFPGMDYGATLQKLQGQGRFVWIRRNITPAQQHAVLQLGQPGLAFEHEVKRYYPHGPLFSHMVGYTDVDSNGLGGVERSFNKYLAGGQDLRLSMDIRLQHILHREVSRAMSDFSAIGGGGVIMDARTGEILAGVSLPDFEPDQAGSVKPEQMFNRLTLGVYELGSMFKIFSTAAALDLKKLPLGYQFDVRQPIKVGRFTIKDFHPENRMLTLAEVFMHSSNIGSARMGQMVGTDGLRNFYKDLGLLDTMQFEINEVGKPLVPNPWREVSTLTASYGHGLSTTPLQMSAAVASIVNDGLLVKPTLVLDDRATKKSVEHTDVRVISSKTSEDMRALLRLVVSEGTGGKADVPGYEIGGKTGTAEKSVNGRYDRKKLISSFVSVFPSSDPQYVVMVMVDEPKGNKQSYGYATAGWVAAPAVSRIVSSMASVLALPPQYVPEEKDVSHPLKQYVAVKKKR